jgi:hypothetical protein
MVDHVGVRRPSGEEPELGPSRIPGQEAPGSVVVPGSTAALGSMAAPRRIAAPGQVPVGALLGLHRAAGNAAVVQMLRARAAPAAPIPPAPRRDEEEPSQAAGEEPAPSSLVGNVPALEEGEQPTKAEKTEKRAERDLPPDSEERVDTSGGPFPIAAETSAASAADGFSDAGRAGSVPFGEAADEGFDPLDPDDDLRPRVFIAGGQTGKKAWAGGGGAGPKGNQEAGSAETVEPDYDSNWGGFTENASAWVIDGTGTVKVSRDYVSSDAGDQGNGWYVTDKAAAALKAHEERHVAKSREVYIGRIQPLLDRIAGSYSYGHGKVYKSSDAKALVRRYVDWAASIKAFNEDDIAWNAPNNMIDSEDVGSSRYPVPFNKPRKVNGKEFPFLLRMGDEPNPPE